MNRARMELGFTEKEFWRMTMRKFNILWEDYVKFKYPKQNASVKTDNKKVIGKNERVSIDQLDWM